MNEFNIAQQGWQCPICKRVYSPFTIMCYYCGGETMTSTTSTGTGLNYNPHTDEMTQDIIDKINVNIGLAQEYKENDK